jgi:hypothetical protein
MPTSRGRNQLDALSITIPRCANTKPNFARSLASRMSIGSVIVTPTPTRRAVDRGDQGLGRGEQAQRELTPAVPPARRVVPGVERVRTGQVHPGAERPTRPVTTTARTSSSASRSSSAATSWSFIATV